MSTNLKILSVLELYILLKLPFHPSYYFPVSNFLVYPIGQKAGSNGETVSQNHNSTPSSCVCSFLGMQKSSRGVCFLFLPILGFPATYLGRLWFECRRRAIVPKLISASSPPHLSSWLWAGSPYALQDIKVYSQQEHCSREKRVLVCFAGVPRTCASSDFEAHNLHKSS